MERFDVAGERWADSKTVRHFDYLYYSEGGELLKIRVIEAASSDGATSSIKVDDYFFIGRELRMVRLYFFASGTRLNEIKSGAVVPMLTGEHIEFSDGKLSKWIALGKNIAPTDRRWADKQSSVELSAKVELLKYKSFKKPKGSK